MIQHRLLCAATLATLATAPLTKAAPCTLAALGWMAADWRNATDPKGSEERWAVAPGNVLMGSSFEFPAGKAGFAEIMTIKQDGDGIAMVLRHFDGSLTRAWEERTAPMLFTAASCDKTAVVFDGQGDHAGEHMTYKRAGKNLLIIGEFLHHGTPDHEEWHMVKAGN